MGKTMGACVTCFCCKGDEERMSLVLRKFPPKLPSDTKNGEIAKGVGRARVNPGDPVLTAPLSGRQCVHYSVTVYELREERHSNIHSDHHHHDRRPKKRWYKLLHEGDAVDFWLSGDQGTALHVNKNQCATKAVGDE